MEAKRIDLPLVVIVGPTASGKTSLAIDIAKLCHGEIICADSRTVYKGADVGTAKPNHAEQSMVPHWGLDLVEPNEHFSVADFKAYTNQKIDEIKSRGHIPFLVGGTGLYVDAVLFDYKFGVVADNTTRTKLQQMSLKELYQHCIKHNITLPVNYQNKRHVIRTIENKGVRPKRSDLPLKNSIVVGITTNKDILRSRITQRIEQIFDDDVVGEAKKLGDIYSWENEAMKSNAYQLVHRFLGNEISFADMKEKNVTMDWRLAKRQLAWLRRNRFIHWLTLNEARTYILNKLAIRE